MQPSKAFRVIRAIVVLVILSGIGMLFYPILANWYNDHYTSRIVSEYNKHVTELDESAVADLFAAAGSFNSSLLTKTGRWEFDDEDRHTYEEVLDVSGTGMIGTLFIPKIRASVPFYHGNSDTVLQIAAGHMEGSSFPIEGDTVHGVIAAHTGMATMELFTKLDQMEKGDQFMVQILNRQYTYRICDIQVVLPTEMDCLDFLDHENLVTLLTCTPLGVNSHRLLVTGMLEDVIEISDEELRSNASSNSWVDYLIYGCMTVFGIILCSWSINRFCRRGRRHQRTGGA